MLEPRTLTFQTAAEFEAWHERQPDRWELHDGVAVAMSPERIDHTRIKARIWAALDRALRRAGLPCEALVDGVTVPGPGRRRFIPDASVSCGERLRGDDTQSASPVILVEVLSPGTAEIDHGIKLDSYFALPSVQHYLIVSSSSRMIVHHARLDGERLATRLHHAGPIALDPPGITVGVEDLYEGTDLQADPA